MYVHVYFFFACLFTSAEGKLYVAKPADRMETGGPGSQGWVKVGSITLNQLHGLPLPFSEVVVPADHLIQQGKDHVAQI